MTTRPPRKAELNLMPVMNLVTILIPLLLLGAQLANLGIVESEAPGIVPRTDEQLIDLEPLSLSVAISRAGFTVLGADAVLGAGDDLRTASSESAARVTIPCAGLRCRHAEDYDYAELTRLLGLVKDDYPDDQAVVLVPEDGVAYQVLVSAMDATRSNGARPLFPFVSIAAGRVGPSGVVGARPL